MKKRYYAMELVEVSVCVCISALPVQVVPLHVVVLEHPEILDVLADEAGRQQSMGPQLETLLQGESHALKHSQTNSIILHHSNIYSNNQEWVKTKINYMSFSIYLHA